MFKTKYARLPPPKVDVVAYNAKRRELYLQGIDYLYGKNGKDKNVETAYQLITQSAEMNYPYAISAIGSFYTHGLIVDKDYGKALKIYTEMFNRLNPNAAYNIGILYQKGWGVDIDLDKAAWYFSASAAFAARELCQGEELGMRLLKELFSKIDVNEAVRKYENSPICEFCHGLVPYENEKDYFRNWIISFSLREKLFHAIEKKEFSRGEPVLKNGYCCCVCERLFVDPIREGLEAKIITEEEVGLLHIRDDMLNAILIYKKSD